MIIKRNEEEWDHRGTCTTTNRNRNIHCQMWALILVHERLLLDIRHHLLFVGGCWGKNGGRDETNTMGWTEKKKLKEKNEQENKTKGSSRTIFRPMAAWLPYLLQTISTLFWIHSYLLGRKSLKVATRLSKTCVQTPFSRHFAALFQHSSSNINKRQRNCPYLITKLPEKALR